MKQLFVVGVWASSLSIVLSHSMLNDIRDFANFLPFMKDIFEAGSKAQDHNELIRTDRMLLNNINLNITNKGYLQYDYWDGSACNGTKTFIFGVQTNYCVQHSSNSSRIGTYKIQISDGMSYVLSYRIHSSHNSTCFFSQLYDRPH